MNIGFILLAFVCCVSAETTPGSESTASSTIDPREDLLENARQLDVYAKEVIAKLQAEKREHLAVTLSNEEWSVKMIYNELLNSRPDPARLASLKAELYHMEYRITKEISIIERTTGDQKVQFTIAYGLRKWAKEEMKILEVQNNIKAHEAYQKLEIEVTTLNYFIDELAKVQDIKTLERTEAALRGVEIRINDILRGVGSQS